jgi:hypothetical protein
MSSGLTLYYNRGLQSNYQKGGGLFDNLKKANQFAKDNKIISRGSQIIERMGYNDKLNKYTGGLYNKGVQYAVQNGYGKKKNKKLIKI